MNTIIKMIMLFEFDLYPKSSSEQYKSNSKSIIILIIVFISCAFTSKLYLIHIKMCTNYLNINQSLELICIVLELILSDVAHFNRLPWQTIIWAIIMNRPL